MDEEAKTGALPEDFTTAREPSTDWGRARFRVGDLVGGLIGLSVALPQSIGLGIVLFESMGLNAASGALAGLISVACISLASGIGGSTTGMISAPNGPVVISLMGTLASVVASGVGAGDLPTVLAIVVILGGIFQVLLGVSGGGQLIKYVPYPVVSGLVTAIGLLMIVSQVPAVFGVAGGMAKLGVVFGDLMARVTSLEGLGQMAWGLIPLATTAITLLGIYLIPRKVPSVPGIVGGFVLGLIAFHAVMAVFPGPVPESWTVGSIPGPDSLALNVRLAALPRLPWDLIVVAGLALAVVASIDCMVTAVVADAATGDRHDSRRELLAQGIGQITSGLLGGCGGGGTKGSTLTAIRSGGRRWPAVVVAVGIVALVLFLRPLGRALPVSVLAGVIIHVGFHMLDVRIVTWMRSPKTRVDGILALAVVAATLAFDVMTGVGVGAVISAVLFIRGQSRASAIYNRATGRERRSQRLRNREENDLLDAHGERILYIELRGHLFFGTVDRLFTELYADLKRPVWIVVNMRRVQSLDLSGLNLLHQMIALSTRSGGHMLFANIYPEIAPGRKMSKLLRLLGPGDKGVKAKTFKSSDKALQYAEDGLLAELAGGQPTGFANRVEAADNELCRSLRPSLRSALTTVLRPAVYQAKDRFYSAGDTDDMLFLVVQGEVDIRIPVDKYHYKRLKRVGPGGVFGEMNFLNAGVRVTTAVAATDCEVMVLDPSKIENAGDPLVKEAVQTLRIELGRELVDRMRWATAEICRLEKW